MRILAVDGGQSGIRLRHSELAGVFESAGVVRLAGSDDRVAAGIEAAWRSLGRPPVDRAVLGLTTAPADAARARSLGERVGAATGATEVWVCDDSVTSHAGALSLGWGVSLVAGTGVACLAMPADGEPRVIGGHGYLLGDEGGAFWIGREALRAALRADEGRGAPTALTGIAGERFGRVAEIPVRIHDDPDAVNLVAQFATEVLAVADTDAVAGAIVAEAARELHGVVSAAARLACPGGAVDAAPVALGGRLLTDPSPLHRMLDARLADDGTLRPRLADRSPLEGAMLLGQQPHPGRYTTLVHTWRGGTLP